MPIESTKWCWRYQLGVAMKPNCQRNHGVEDGLRVDCVMGTQCTPPWDQGQSTILTHSDDTGAIRVNPEGCQLPIGTSQRHR